MNDFLQSISTAITMISIAIIVYGVIIGFISFLRNEIKGANPKGVTKIRAQFGGYLLLGLEFLIAADIIRTILDPTYEELIILAGIVLLRTILSVFLNKESKDLTV